MSVASGLAKCKADLAESSSTSSSSSRSMLRRWRRTRFALDSESSPRPTPRARGSCGGGEIGRHRVATAGGECSQDWHDRSLDQTGETVKLEGGGWRYCAWATCGGHAQRQGAGFQLRAINAQGRGGTAQQWIMVGAHVHLRPGRHGPQVGIIM